MGRLIACVLVALAVLLAARGLRDDDRLVDPSTPAAQRAIAVATELDAATMALLRLDYD